MQLPLNARVLYKAPSMRALALQVAAMRWAVREGRETATHAEEGSL
ncbi:hypothetical protein [Azohydromonas lata]|uniref:Uncharacterized protein n=1 Tax=Azohydromonas lata TaxID=45677 RepID=A0ABU5I7H1_9BURK|nr:hypothetical protein [Azohydromonas lata]MDZ5455038.1 hypothetical protein [Azohydromonas lata]